MMAFASARAGTDSIASIRPLLAVAIAFVGVVLIVGCRHRRFGRQGATLFVACCQFTLVCSMIPAVQSGTVLTADFGTFAPGVRFAFRADPLGMLFVLVASGLWVVTTVYSVGYLAALKVRIERGATPPSRSVSVAQLASRSSKTCSSSSCFTN